MFLTEMFFVVPVQCIGMQSQKSKKNRAASACYALLSGERDLHNAWPVDAVRFFFDF
jgi:hypothetical protein